MESKIILCTGGSRSGKSVFAEKLALSLEGQKVYIATATVYDEEMEERVARHQERRGYEWINIECPSGLAKKWESISKQGSVILVDCLTMLVTNALMQYPNMDEATHREEFRTVVLQDVQTLLEQIRVSENKTVIFVTNELGLGIIPSNAVARVFRDVVGEVNQLVAEIAHEVYLSVSGITMEIKSKETRIDG